MKGGFYTERVWKKLKGVSDSIKGLSRDWKCYERFEKGHRDKKGFSECTITL